jgi:hypothetical protein
MLHCLGYSKARVWLPVALVAALVAACDDTATPDGDIIGSILADTYALVTLDGQPLGVMYLGAEIHVSSDSVTWMSAGSGMIVGGTGTYMGDWKLHTLYNGVFHSYQMEGTGTWRVVEVEYLWSGFTVNLEIAPDSNPSAVLSAVYRSDTLTVIGTPWGDAVFERWVNPWP